jgi:hypothetical protein
MGPGQRHAPAAFPLCRRLVGPEREQKLSPPPGFDTPDRLARSEDTHRGIPAQEIPTVVNVNIMILLNTALYS